MIHSIINFLEIVLFWGLVVVLLCTLLIAAYNALENSAKKNAEQALKAQYETFNYQCEQLKKRQAAHEQQTEQQSEQIKATNAKMLEREKAAKAIESKAADTMEMAEAIRNHAERQIQYIQRQNEKLQKGIHGARQRAKRLVNRYQSPS